MQISIIDRQNSKYPESLRHIAGPPKQLYMLGSWAEQPSIAIVGTRNPSAYGKQVTYQLAGELASAGITIVSGLALGIDGIAHQAALDAGGHTVAVMGGGLDNIYPATHRELAKRILASGGAIVSEYEVGIEPKNFTFPARNRIISGLSRAVLVTEANAKSGSLITAKFSLEQGREVLAIPGAITSPLSAGPNNLIKSGATPVTSSSDILASLGLASPELSRPIRAASAEEATILTLMNEGLSAGQELIIKSGLSPQEFANVITLMEISGKVRNLGAGTWIRGS